MNQKGSRENTMSSSSNLPKFQEIKGFQKFAIRSNSPRTLQACDELGVDPNILEIRDENDFRQNDLDEEIIQLRYQHYLNRTHQLFTEINQRRKEIIQRHRQRILNQNNSIESLDRSKTQKMHQSVEQGDLKKQIDCVYNRTVSFLNQRSESPTKDQLFGDIYELNQLEGGIGKEINRYNKHKQQKIREAQLKLQEDAKNLELIEKWKKKDTQVLEQLVKRQYSFKRKILSSQRRQEHLKMPHIKDQKTLNRESQSIQERSDDILFKTMQRTREDSKAKLRRETVQQRKEHLDKVDDNELEKDLIKLQWKLCKSEKISKQQAQIRVDKIKEQQQKEQLLVSLQKEVNITNAQENLSNMISKMITKEQEFRGQIQSQLLSDIEKKKIIKEKQKRVKQNKNNLFQYQDQKMKELNEKFEKIEEQTRIRKKELEHKVLLKQELRKLKEQDKIDNYERQKRQNDYRMMTLYRKQKMIEEKNQIKQYQNDVLQKTSMEFNKHEIQERQRIYSQLQELSDNLLNYKSASQHEQRQKIDQAKLKSVKILQEFSKLDDPALDGNTKIIMNMLQPKKIEQDNSTRKTSILIK